VAMAALRSRRLEALFGARLEDVTPENVQGLVDAGAQEAFDLDFKRDLYGRSDSDKRAFAGDVAALANSAGGVIVNASPRMTKRKRRALQASRSPMPRSAGCCKLSRGSCLQCPPSTCSPFSKVSHHLHTTAGPRRLPNHIGFFLIAVPRSPSAPHAVLINEALRYPKRNGSTTRYLSEPEVAASYRDRLTGAAAQVDLLDFG
jgi:hypothetical protein